jgi:hypothetical protein
MVGPFPVLLLVVVKELADERPLTAPLFTGLVKPQAPAVGALS